MSRCEELGYEGIRHAGAGDAEALVSLIRAAYRGPLSRAGWTSEADLLEGERIDLPALRAVIADARSRLLVCDRSGRLAGCCEISDRGSGLAYFGMFAVAPHAQGQGIGRRLFDTAQRLAREALRARVIELRVLAPQLALIAWYERLGFSATGETARFVADPRFARPLVDDLRFVVMRKTLA
jgi:ribosomal protein S18 acetylase RimI-like enzyme